MATGVQVWSTTASQNSTADTNVNWAEGMAPSQVNDSARAVMASVAKWRDDNNGTLVTSGSTTAYTITSNQVEGALTAGYTVTFQIHATNDTSATLNVDGLGAKPLQATTGTNLQGGELISGNIYRATYSTTGTGQWILQDTNVIAASGQVYAATITYAKIQNVAASRLLGNPTGSPAAPSEITLGTNLTFSGTTLNAGNNTPVVTTITSTATATWQSTTQNGAFPLYLRVRMVGGGGGGGANNTNSGSSGTDTTFNNWTAVGGGKGITNSGAGGAGGGSGGNGTGTLITRVSGQSGQIGGATSGTFAGAGGNSVFAGAGWGNGANAAGVAAQANTGSGGGGGHSAGVGGGGGGAGEFAEFIVTSPSTSYTVQVGPGGAGGTAGGQAGGNGAAGRIEVVAYWQ